MITGARVAEGLFTARKVELSPEKGVETRRPGRAQR
jgi:hypothetical protein